MDWKFEKNMYPILDTRVLIQIGVKLFSSIIVTLLCLRALLIQIGVKHFLQQKGSEIGLRALLI